MAARPLNRDYSMRREFVNEATRSDLNTAKHTVLNINSSRSSLSEPNHTDPSLPTHLRGAFPDLAGAEFVLDHAPPKVLPSSLSRPDLAAESNQTTIASALTNAASTAPQVTQGGYEVASTRLPDFFGHGVFKTALHNPTISHQLLRYARARLAGESIEFLARVTQYHAMLTDVRSAIASIHKDFISGSAEQPINLDSAARDSVNQETRSALLDSLPALGAVFVKAQSDIERLVYSDIYPHFVRHAMSMSAARALGSNRHKYAGLGDCFVLTDPSKADNPIVFASDGFVAVTGYSRTEIIPRNCRFLQGSNTNQMAVKRLKTAIHNREESVEILLNERKNGEPFLNLLYTTPLFGENKSKPAFFLGGQVNCSTSIHSTNDVLRILAQSEDDEPKATEIAGQPIKQRKSTNVFHALRSRKALPSKTPGMESELLDQMEHMTVNNQVNTFYTAYSHFIVINASTFLIGFISKGISELLFPIRAKAQHAAQAIGCDIFKFLAAHGSGNRDFRSTVKGALKSGQAISLEVKLCARPYMGIEKFVSHWTPLKDEHGAVHWIVLTLGNEQRIGLAY